MKIESTKSFSTGPDGGTVSRTFAAGDGLQRTPPITFDGDDEDDLDEGAAWLAATGVADLEADQPVSPAVAAALAAALGDDEPQQSASDAWLVQTGAGFA